MSFLCWYFDTTTNKKCLKSKAKLGCFIFSNTQQIDVLMQNKRENSYRCVLTNDW